MYTLYQEVDTLRKKRERLITEVASIRSVRQREPDLQGMKGQKAGVQSRLRYAERELGHIVSSSGIVNTCSHVQCTVDLQCMYCTCKLGGGGGGGGSILKTK